MVSPLSTSGKKQYRLTPTKKFIPPQLKYPQEVKLWKSFL
ncbi:hypothetical protein HMPREF9134_01876 [Porphyromonas catoniae F0037]|uniref:Uncharacterized protein n=1 Tax=Porphyromonas catoniae F0037 TaxID=1127696 RepID=L1N9B1_9PORP|nr:hypothetical protein HMPREF9134_01876 [Porphyromonas catoniae F0037]